MAYSRVNFASYFTLRDTRGTAPTILNLHFFSFKIQQLDHRYPSDRTLSGPQFRSGSCVMYVGQCRINKSWFWVPAHSFQIFGQTTWFSRESSLFQPKFCVDSLLPNMKQRRLCHVSLFKYFFCHAKRQVCCLESYDARSRCPCPGHESI